jgi:hypothetical protein
LTIHPCVEVQKHVMCYTALRFHSYYNWTFQRLKPRVTGAASFHSPSISFIHIPPLHLIFLLSLSRSSLLPSSHAVTVNLTFHSKEATKPQTWYDGNTTATIKQKSNKITIPNPPAIVTRRLSKRVDKQVLISHGRLQWQEDRYLGNKRILP